MRHSIPFVLVMLLSACGTTSSVKMAVQVPDKTSFVFRDERPAEQKISRTDTSSSGVTESYGDDKLFPPATEMLRAKLQEKLGTQLGGKTVSISTFNVRVFDPVVSVDTKGLNSAVASVRGGYAAAPLAGVLVYGIEKIKNEKSVDINIEGTVDIVPFSSVVSDRYRGRVSEDNLRTSLLHAFEKLTEILPKLDPEKYKAAKAQEAALAKEEERKLAMEKPGDKDCSKSDQNFLAETKVRRGKSLMNANDYKAAMVCFLQAQEDETSSSIHADA